MEPHNDARWTRQLHAELRRAAFNVLRGKRPAMLQPTALVHEAYLRLRRSRAAAQAGRTAFVVAAVGEMRRAMIDAIRAERAQKRGGDAPPVSLDTSMLSLAGSSVDYSTVRDALDRLAALSERQARVVELRFFGGLNEEETASALGVSRRTVQGDWRGARAWLRRDLATGAPEARPAPPADPSANCPQRRAGP